MIQAAIIGLGAIGQRVLSSFINYTEIRISAICDQNPDVTRETLEKTGDILSFTDHVLLLKEADVDLVYIAVPPKFHHRIATDVMLAGKHVLCEKPLANSLEEAESLAALADEKGIVHAMNFPLLYSAGSSTFASLIKEGYIGKLRRLELKLHLPAWPRPWQQNVWVAGKEQGGFVLEVGVHYIHQIQRIFGPVTVLDKFVQYPDDPNSCEIGILTRLQLEDGTPVVIDGLSGIAGDEEIRFTAYGTEGTLSLLNWADLEGGKLGEKVLPIEADESLTGSLVLELTKALKGEKANLADFHEGLHAQMVLEQLRGE
ncbi:Gfo/Idh/MocA family protein [Metabacillus indicus]|uniref:Gfo/Idh/MocA family protein n=1 Tax=Metabacillus indicus TaxID=246786 RepID=UPI0024907A9F|nr:Gfo/Idh/MocA family oxidoreductase [Metabacillus indicus]